MPSRDDVAKAMAERMPLVHYPVNALLDEWSSWTALKSREARGLSLEPGPFGALRGRHVYTYAGPSCYYRDGMMGDAAMYFAPGTEVGKKGSATPFDSGALEDEPARLQPFRSRNTSVEERWAFFEAQEVKPLDGFRARFEGWLLYAYDDPMRYLDTKPDRLSAGEPYRLEPPELLEYNGSRGRMLYGPTECGDRRTWTWEVRIEGELSLDEVVILHVPFESYDQALSLAERIQDRTGQQPRIEVLPRNIDGDKDSIYEASGDILRGAILGGAT
jgi:hypothetical protein